MADAETGLSAEIAEEYEVWKKNCPVMYASINESVLEWPSLTFQWMPRTSEETALVGTMTGEGGSEEEPEYLAIIEPKLGGVPENFTRQKSGSHQGEVNRARVSPHDATQIASIGPSGLVTIWSTKEFEKPVKALEGHAENGYGLSWNPITENVLLSGAEDGQAIVWDVKTGKQIWSVKLDSGINDVAWSHTGRKLSLATESGSVRVYTYNDGDVSEDFTAFDAHEKGVNAIGFNPFTDNMLATASDDQTIGIWDLRDTHTSVHILSGHTAPVTVLKWSPLKDGILASASPDRRVILWDLTRVGQEQQADDAEDAVPELVFMHGGHTAPVSDFDWHPTEPWLIGSLSEDNICQVWVPSPAATGSAKIPEMPRYLL